MPEIRRGQSSSCSNPVLDLYTRISGTLVDLYSLEFAIFDEVTTPGTPIQVYPPTGNQAVNVTDLCPTGDKLGTGHYKAAWTVPLIEPLGIHTIRWRFRLTAESAFQTFTEEFTVLPEAAGDGYCTVADLRARGVPSTGFGARSDADLLLLIQDQSRLIDMYTGRWFGPRSLTLRLDGTGRRGFMLEIPIISVSAIRLIGSDFESASEVELSSVRIYNRHMSGLMDPDDRENPRIEWAEFDKRWESDWGGGDIGDSFYPTRWPEGTQNVEVTGVFGFTDPDGTPTGRTPEGIRQACILMVLKAMISPLDPDYFDTANAWRLTSLRTRDQTITWDAPSRLGSRGVGAFTGDPAIDNLLVRYFRQAHLGAA